MQLLYDGLDTEKAVWLRAAWMPWVLILAVTLVVCTAILDASITSEQRIVLFQHSGMFP
jgi:uncharacterized membrane protein